MPLQDDFDIEKMRLPPRAEAAQVTKPKREKQTKPFVMVSIQDVIAAAKTLKSPTLLMWLLLAYRAKMQGVDAVKVTGKDAAVWGIDRRTKHRTLKALEAAGLIEIRRQGRQAPTVALRLSA